MQLTRVVPALILSPIALVLFFVWTVCWISATWISTGNLALALWLCFFPWTALEMVSWNASFAVCGTIISATRILLVNHSGASRICGRLLCVLTLCGYLCLGEGTFWQGVSLGLVALSGSNMWLRDSRADLLATQARLIAADNPGLRYKASTVAGLGTIEVLAEGNKDGACVVLINGFGAGNGNYRNTLTLLSQAGFRVFAIEWLGWGLSDRPKWNARTPEEALDYLVPRIQEWRNAMHIESMTLCGHSMGGIIASEYALRYPEYVSHLVLASPAGVPSPRQPSTPPKSVFVRLFSSDFLWKAMFHPLGVLRWLGPVSSMLVRWMIKRRFSRMSSESQAHTLNTELLADYLQQLWSQNPPCSEGALNVLLKGRAQSAGLPLISKLVGGGRLHDACGHWSLSLIYGDESDWMGSQHGQELQSRLRQLGKPDVWLYVLNTGGHQVFNENAAGCAGALISAHARAQEFKRGSWDGPRDEWERWDHGWEIR